MADDVDAQEGTDIQVSSYDEAPPNASSAETAKRSAPGRAMDRPGGIVGKGLGWYRRLDQRDRLVVLMGILVFVLAIVIILIYLSGGGFGGDGDEGPIMVPISEWDRSGLDTILVEGDEENTNLESQHTPYLVPVQPNATQVYFITRLTAHVTWSDETTPPTSMPAIGYTNQPDGFMLQIVIQDEVGLWESELEFNTIGQSHEITLDVDLEAEPGGPIAVANPQGAKYLPEGYHQAVRVDFIVFTEDCGDWTTNDPRPPIGDGGNHYSFQWTLEYKLGSTTKGP